MRPRPRFSRWQRPRHRRRTLPPYVDTGTDVALGDTLCIIEAMKLMNELECEVRGTIVEICVENAQPVEYGQVLFRVDPA